ncbi:hypothetical protein RJT34_11665 [Clitoria ternatea]|uniref:Uncharacterized protein n=1 Tax=Clitoria ternatea TaxID=43366 RepID=A0AAN9PK90_CLITE
MSKPPNFLQRPSNIIVQSKQRKQMVMYHDHGNNLTRDLSNLSNEGYHNESASIPFDWESQPGTPKVRFKENSLPPLTPPPSYFQNATTKKPNTKAKNKTNPSKSSFLQTIFPKRGNRKGCAVSQKAGSTNFLSYSSSSSSSSSSLSSSSPRPKSYSVPSSPMIRRGGGEDEDLYEVSSSSLCFGNAMSRGCYSSMFKKVLLGDFM